MKSYGVLVPRIVAVPLLLLFAYPASADEPAAAKETTGIVFRVSRELLRKHHIPEFDESSPINMCLFGSRITGTAKTSGRASITLEANEKDAVFTFQFKGSTTSKSVATQRSVAVYSTGTTEFLAHREIHFDGVRFRADAAAIEATTSSVTDCISVSAFPFNRIVRRIAEGEVEKNRSAGDAIALRDVKRRVVESFDAETDAFVTKLNGVVTYEAAIAHLVPKTAGWINHLATSPDYLILSPGPAGAKIAVLPKEAKSMRAPLELWVRKRPSVDSSRLLIESFVRSQRALDSFRTLVTGKEKKVETVAFTAIGDWWVLKIGEDLMEKWIEKIEKK